jgi:hypothetical protein
MPVIPDTQPHCELAREGFYCLFFKDLGLCPVLGCGQVFWTPLSSQRCLGEGSGLQTEQS